MDTDAAHDSARTRLALACAASLLLHGGLLGWWVRTPTQRFAPTALAARLTPAAPVAAPAAALAAPSQTPAAADTRAAGVAGPLLWIEVSRSGERFALPGEFGERGLRIADYLPPELVDRPARPLLRADGQDGPGPGRSQDLVALDFLAMVDDRGSVRDLALLQAWGQQGFAEAARAALLAARFTAGEREGIRVPSRVQVRLYLRIE